MHHFWFSQKACLRVNGYGRDLGLESWRFSSGQIGGKPQVEGWVRLSGWSSGMRASRVCCAARTAAHGPCQRCRCNISEKAFPGLASVTSNPCSEGKKEYCFMMGWSFLVTHSFRSIGNSLCKGHGASWCSVSQMENSSWEGLSMKLGSISKPLGKADSASRQRKDWIL